MAPIPGIAGGGFGAGVAPADLSFVTSTSTSANTNYYNLTSVSFGAAVSTRRVLVVGSVTDFNADGPISVSSVTIGGVSATIHRQGGNDLSVFVASAAVPTGTTGSVVINTGSSAGQCSIAVYRVTNRSSLTVADSGTSTSTSSPTINLSLANGGFVLGGIHVYTASAYPSIAGHGLGSANATINADAFEYFAAYSGQATVSGSSNYAGTYPSSDFRANGMTVVCFR